MDTKRTKLEQGVPLHQPLKLDSIRLLELLPDRYDKPIRCHLSQHVFDLVDDYECVSYVWGSPDDQEAIFINGLTISVRRNLFDCLMELRDIRTAKTLWIDAICIDQSNTLELGHSVGMMDEIFSRAEHVYVWLGRADQLSDRAMSFLEDGFLKGLGPENRDQLFGYGERDSSEIRKGLFELFARPYWTRTWTIQEFILAKDLILICGNQRVKALPVIKSCRLLVIKTQRLLYKNGHADPRAPTGYWDRGRTQIIRNLSNTHAVRLMAYCAENTKESHQYRRMESHVIRQPLWEVLMYFHMSECSNPLDHLYAMFSLASDFYQDRKQLTDYSVTPRQLLFRVAVHFARINSDHALKSTDMKAIKYLHDAMGIPSLENQDTGNEKISLNDTIKVQPKAVDEELNVHVSVRWLLTDNVYRLLDSRSIEVSTYSEPNTMRDFDDNWISSYIEKLSDLYRPNLSVRFERGDVIDAKQTRNEQGGRTPKLSPKLFLAIHPRDGSHLDLGLLCSQARHGDILVQSRSICHLAFVFRALHRSAPERKEYKAVGTAILVEDVERRRMEHGSLMQDILASPLDIPKGHAIPVMNGKIGLLPNTATGLGHKIFWMNAAMLMKLAQFLKIDENAIEESGISYVFIPR